MSFLREISVLNKIKSVSVIILGIVLTSAGVGLFYIPNNIVTGGVSGIAAILVKADIPPGIVYITANTLLISLSYKILGKDFFVKSVISAILMSVMVQFFSSLPKITDDLFLSAFFGSSISALGTAITFSENANTGGSDILGRLIQHRFPYFPIGSIILVIDFIIIAISVIVFRTAELALFGIFGLIISSIVIDFFIDRLNSSKLALVVTEKGDLVSETLIKNSRRGVTVLDAKGAYSKNSKKLLVCAIKNRQMPDFHKMIAEADKNAFIIFLKSENIFGLGFYVYK